MNVADEQEECVDQTPKKEKKAKKKKTKTTKKTRNTETELKVTTNTETETAPYAIYVPVALVCASVMLLMVFAPP